MEQVLPIGSSVQPIRLPHSPETNSQGLFQRLGTGRAINNMRNVFEVRSKKTIALGILTKLPKKFLEGWKISIPFCVTPFMLTGLYSASLLNWSVSGAISVINTTAATSTLGFYGAAVAGGIYGIFWCLFEIKRNMQSPKKFYIDEYLSLKCELSALESKLRLSQSENCKYYELKQNMKNLHSILSSYHNWESEVENRKLKLGDVFCSFLNYSPTISYIGSFSKYGMYLGVGVTACANVLQTAAVGKQLSDPISLAASCLIGGLCGSGVGVVPGLCLGLVYSLYSCSREARLTEEQKKRRSIAALDKEYVKLQKPYLEINECIQRFDLLGQKDSLTTNTSLELQEPEEPEEPQVVVTTV